MNVNERDIKVEGWKLAAQEAIDAITALGGVKMTFAQSSGVALAKQSLINALAETKS